MIVGVLQPSYLPWLGFFEQIFKSDIFVFYDDVQFEKGSWRNRNRIKVNEQAVILTVPVKTKGLGSQLIKDIKINNITNWQTKHIKTIEQNYSKTKYYKEYSTPIFEIINRNWDNLCQLNMVLTKFICQILGIQTKTILSSKLNIHGQGEKRLIDIIKHLKGSIFYEGSAGRNYINDESFKQEGIVVKFQDYNHPIYEQKGNKFISHLSIIDLIFNHGPNSLSILSYSASNNLQEGNWKKQY